MIGKGLGRYDRGVAAKRLVSRRCAGSSLAATMGAVRMSRGAQEARMFGRSSGLPPERQMSLSSTSPIGLTAVRYNGQR